jgi:hypothetical protein
MKILEHSKETARLLLETPEELVDGWRCHLNKSPEDDIKGFTEAVQNLPVEITDTASKSAIEGGGGFGIFTIETDYLKPYWDLLKKRTGTDPFNVDLLFAVGGIKHTHTVLRFESDESGKGAADVFCVSWPLMGEKLNGEEGYRLRGEKNALRYINEAIGKTETEPEFIEVRGGLFKHNPKYGRGQSPVVPSLSNETLWQGLFGAWLEKFGTPEQKAIIARFARVYRSKELFPSLREYGDSFHIDNYNGSFKWSEFQTLGKGVTA